ncbi:maleylpyruvate isomerase [Actinoplanes sp. SE50]|uniref:maleylpyruvate isomerase family mycothiol-dependent enzyme n=1 Tax=unclassified Actinoplanes TaxID=2626549 RepID=UPI00023ED1C4|nr:MULTISPECIES: maleylpyruvate isomerase family mycothiol-dependent enzyme [unclassified Actinoplanes]AEV82742.1 mycothiol-dependent maleylpyruvate isomerase [Actinoplanes sp. SE50/110]ATO81138.1 maleylpyruvate isomerase [Actinoplanes sp. SE50]SLL98545.1 maleylpyruvate isomerase [Actinoplanes sp. SE50/110]
MTIDPLVLMTDVDQATDNLLRAAGELDDSAIGEPSALPGWTVGHVLTHLARNAEALTNLLTWARTGVETPAYASREARDAAIEAGAGRPLADQLADIRTAHERFADAAAAMPAEAWTFRYPSLMPSAAVVPWARLREVEVHHVDLGRGYTPADWSDAFALRLLREIAGDLPESAPPMVLHPAGVDHPLLIGSGDGPAIGGPTRSIAAWLAGRADGADLTVSPDGELPQPARWK